MQVAWVLTFMSPRIKEHRSYLQNFTEFYSSSLILRNLKVSKESNAFFTVRTIQKRKRCLTINTKQRNKMKCFAIKINEKKIKYITPSPEIFSGKQSNTVPIRIFTM